MRLLVLFSLFGMAGVGFAQHKAAFDPAKIVDLSYAYDEKTIYWPTSPPFVFKRESWGKSAGGYWYASGTFTISEHGGTHIDSPIHFGEGQIGTSDIPLTKLTGAACVVDVSKAAAGNPDYLVTVADVEGWEKRHGRLGAGDIVLFRTGWGKRWPDKKAYMGTDTPGDTKGLRFPGISKAAAEFVLRRGVNGIGIDTASIDYGRSSDFQAHRVLNGAGIYALENVANLDRLPETGATLLALPVKIKGGTGGPVRIAAILP